MTGFQIVKIKDQRRGLPIGADVGQLGVLFEGYSQPDARKVTYMSLLQIFANPNKMLDWLTNSNLILLTNI